MNDPRIPHDRAPGSPGDVAPARAGHDGVGESDGYSATALGSHWFEHPGPEETASVAPENATLVQAAQPENATLVQDAPENATLVQDAQPTSVAPDRVEGEVLRFGPGVTAVVRNRNRDNTTAALWHGTLPGRPAGPEPRERRRGGLRRYALAATVLLAVLAFLAWQRYGPGLAVRDVAVQTAAEGPGCEGTADVVGVLETNGRPGTVTYRWVRSDGTESGLLREKMTRGQKQAHLHLLWTFRGRGEYRAGAELRIISPSRHTVAVQFRYRCV
ncbi:hypothetical protein ACFWDI_11645 [Streptomyces sp. NPDC060064]|uniref:hypothetical protein n=1 Tax=Streptomyces sp. NPDC060064 TaxID=3347049 RepID=UPI00368BE638